MLVAIAVCLAFAMLLYGLSACSSQEESSDDYEIASLIEGASTSDGCPVRISPTSGLESVGAVSGSGVWGYRGETDSQGAWAAVDDAMSLAGWNCPESDRDVGVGIYTRDSPDADGYSMAIVSVSESGGSSAVILAFG